MSWTPIHSSIFSKDWETFIALFKKPPNTIGIPTIVLYELEVGIAKSNSSDKRITQLEALTSIVNILPFGNNEVRCAAAILADLEIKDTPIEPYDVLIAGTAMSNQGIPATHNTKEYERIEGLRLEDWY